MNSYPNTSSMTCLKLLNMSIWYVRIVKLFVQLTSEKMDSLSSNTSLEFTIAHSNTLKPQALSRIIKMTKKFTVQKKAKETLPKLSTNLKKRANYKVFKMIVPQAKMMITQTSIMNSIQCLINTWSHLCLEYIHRKHLTSSLVDSKVKIFYV